MIIRADEVRQGDQVHLAGDWLTVKSYAIMKPYLGPSTRYTHTKLWFTDETAFMTYRDSELEVERP